MGRSIDSPAHSRLFQPSGEMLARNGHCNRYGLGAELHRRLPAHRMKFDVRCLSFTSCIFHFVSFCHFARIFRSLASEVIRGMAQLKS